MTGDRLTLRDADERRRWAREHDAFLAPRRAGLSVDEDLGARADAWADSRVRAYRERLPEATVDAPNTGGRYGTHLVLPPGWTLGTTPAGEWRVTDTGEAVDLTGPDAEGLARSAWKHWARAECCPTEGASDAVNVEGLLKAIGAIERHAKHIKANADDGRVWDSSKRLKKLAGRARRAVTGRRRPSTGEASPDTDQIKSRLETVTIQRDRQIDGRKRDRAKLGALIEAALGACLDLSVMREAAEHDEADEAVIVGLRAVRSRLRAVALDAKGDAPTPDAGAKAGDLLMGVARSLLTGDRRPIDHVGLWMERHPGASREEAIAGVLATMDLPAPAPQVPDSPGWTTEQIDEVARQLVHQWGGLLGPKPRLFERFCVHINDGLRMAARRGGTCEECGEQPRD